jgi:hypothetical protein
MVALSMRQDMGAVLDVQNALKWATPGSFCCQKKQVKHTVALAPRHMGKQRRWGREGNQGLVAGISINGVVFCGPGQ